MKELIEKSMKLAFIDDDYINFTRNKKLNDGKANEVFKKAVIEQAQIDYSSYINNGNIYSTYQLNNGQLVGVGPGQQFDKLIDSVITNLTLHKQHTRTIKNLALNEKPVFTVNEENKELFDEFEKTNDLTDLLLQGIGLTNYSGGGLYKACYVGKNERSIDIITNQNYFPIFSDSNKTVVLAYLEYTLEKECEDKKDEVFRVTLHKKGSTEIFFTKSINNDCKFIPLDVEESLEYVKEMLDGVEYEETNDTITFGKLEVGEIVFDEKLGTWKHIYKWETPTFDVAESFFEIDRVNNKPFGISAFENHSIQSTRDYIGTSTLQKSVVKALGKPKIVMSSDFAEKDLETGETTINVDKEVYIARAETVMNGNKPLFEQVPIDLKTEELKQILQQYKQEILSALGLTPALIGEQETGGLSGTAKELDLVNIKAQVEIIRKNVGIALEQVINFLFMVDNIDLGLHIVFGDIFPPTALENANLAVLELNNGLGLKRDILQAYTGYNNDKMEELMKEIDSKPITTN